MPAQAFMALSERLQADEDVIGAFLSGSRSKGFHGASSDYDVYIVVQGDTAERAKRRYPFRYSVDLQHRYRLHRDQLDRFSGLHVVGEGSHWDRYSFAHVNVLFERINGTLQKLIERKGKIPAEYRTSTLCQTPNAYLNAVYGRSSALKEEANLEQSSRLP